MRPQLVLLLCLAAVVSAASPHYFDDDSNNLGDYGTGGFDDYTENDLQNIFEAAQKRGSRIYLYRRGCVRRGGNCDHRPSDCCQNSACRCNLWGANCRCQRKGLFQKWGK
ncbi:U8-agatoxin-Ao1a isoform X3 [Halyomorpha halys]|uniref:U8-agatoxin-Ao1a isoform X3 n=1 Tax=Halyomorpha halys TaxID=286706 RepID=UPI0006D4DCC9|nr:U8-agatoxin-Ao1a-like isoform X3 [Halyomorpha halys]